MPWISDRMLFGLCEPMMESGMCSSVLLTSCNFPNVVYPAITGRYAPAEHSLEWCQRHQVGNHSDICTNEKQTILTTESSSRLFRFSVAFSHIHLTHHRRRFRSPGAPQCCWTVVSRRSRPAPTILHHPLSVELYSARYTKGTEILDQANSLSFTSTNH